MAQDQDIYPINFNNIIIAVDTPVGQLYYVSQ